MKFRRFISIFMALMLMISLIPTVALASNDWLSIDVASAQVGEDITVKVIAQQEVQGIADVSLSFSFNKDVYNVKSVTWNNIGSLVAIGSDVSAANSAGNAAASWNDTYGATTLSNGTEICTLVFTPLKLDNVNNGLSMSLSITDAGAGDITPALGTVVKSVTITLPPSTIVINTYAGKTYDGAVVTDPTDVTVTGSDGAVTFKYYSDENCNSEISAPAKAGTYWVKATVAANATHAAATSAAKSFTIEKADYTYAGPTESTDKTVGNQYPAGGYAYAAGVNSETVTGTLGWFTDSECTAAATGTFNNVGTETLYWQFTTADTNYVTVPKTGSVTFNVSALPVQDVTYGQVSTVDKTYGDPAFTIAAVNNTQNGGAITYSSSDENIAAVNASTGEVTIKKQGSVEVTATAAAVTGYAQTAAKYTLNIAKKELTITDAEIAAKKYDGNTTAAVTSVTLDGIVPNETLVKDTDYTVTGVYNDADVADANKVTVTVTLLNTAMTDNYKIAGTFDKVATIAKADGAAAPAVTGSYAVSTTDDSKFAYTVTPVSGAEYSDDGTTYQDSNVFDNIIPESTATFYARIKGSDNVEVGAAGNTGAVTFNKLDYPSAPTLNYNVTGDSGNRTITITEVTGAEYAFDNGNYSDVNTKSGINDATVTVKIRYKATATMNASQEATASVNTAKEAQTLSFAEASVNKTYGNAAFTVTAANDRQDGGAIAYSSTNQSVATVDAAGKVTIAGAGTATIKAQAAENAKYSQSAEASYTLTVAQAPITVTAKSYTIKVNGTVPDLTQGTHYTVTGLVGNDVLGGTVAVKYQKNGQDAAPDKTKAGTYDIVISGAEAPNANYATPVHVNGTLKIEQEYVGGGGYYVPTVQKPTIEAGEGVKVTLSADGKVATIEALEGYELESVKLNEIEKGIVKEVKDLKTGDKLVATAKKLLTPAEELSALLGEYKLVARSKRTEAPSGKKAIMIYWFDENGKQLELDGVEIFRSVKKNDGYGIKPIFTSKSGKYYNTSIETGTRYYYMVRGYVELDGVKYFTDWSKKAWRTAK